MIANALSRLSDFSCSEAKKYEDCNLEMPNTVFLYKLITLHLHCHVILVACIQYSVCICSLVFFFLIFNILLFIIY